MKMSDTQTRKSDATTFIILMVIVALILVLVWL